MKTSTWKWEQRGDDFRLVENARVPMLVLSINRGTLPTNSDARVIASAPELLAALEALLAVSSIRDDCEEIAQRAAAAIRKAKGEE